VICEDLDASGTGAVRAGVDVVVLDDDLRAVPPGNVGRLAIRSPAVPAGYVDRPQESAAAFREGWFLSGDAGALLASRMLRLEGRQDDLVNLGGIKLPAMRFESALRAQPAIADAAVLAINLADGATLGVAAVLREGVSVDAGMLQVRAALRLEAGVAAKVLFVQAVPRLAEGKTDRMALLDAFRRYQSPAT
jgi:acyl-CoA synthetase (AMP-forming)/AMP-acid ligase II